MALIAILAFSRTGYPSLALNPSYNMNSLANSYSASAGYASAYNQTGYGCLNPYAASSTFAAAAAASSAAGATSAAASAYDQATSDALGCYGLAATLSGGTDPLSSLKTDSR